MSLKHSFYYSKNTGFVIDFQIVKACQLFWGTDIKYNKFNYRLIVEK